MSEQLRLIDEHPDHGREHLGRFAHAALEENPDPEQPLLFLCYNTLPEPPIPSPMFRSFPLPEPLWTVSGEDLDSFLELIVSQMESNPLGSASDYDQATVLMMRTMRLDAAALLFRAHVDARRDGESAAAPPSDVAEGHCRHGDAACANAENVTVAQAVDRESGHVMLTSERSSPAPRRPWDPCESPRSELLRRFVTTHYDWNTAVFGPTRSLFTAMQDSVQPE